MRDLKYIIFQINDFPEITRAAVFSGMLCHQDVASGVGYMPLSAGFCNLQFSNGLDVETYGHSESLNLGPMPGDDLIISKTLTNTHFL